MNLIVLDGRLGAGKTLGMSFLARKWAMESGCALYSNYALTGSKPIQKLEDFLDVARQHSSLVCLDESHLDLSSRDFNTNSVRFFTNLIYYLRKMRCTLIMTTPLFTNLDARVRDIVNVYISVSKKNGFFYYDFYNVESGRLIKGKRVIYEDMIVRSNGLYDTYAIVTPLEYPSKKEEFVSFLQDLKSTNQAYISQLAQRDAERIAQPSL